eukprot:gene14339-15835_t
MASACSTSAIVVWEWEGDQPGNFIPYDSRASNWIEQQRDLKMSEVDLSSVDSFHANWKIIFRLGKQISRFGVTREVRRKVYSGSYPIKDGIVWEWKADFGWQQYNVKIAKTIEKCYNRGDTEFDLGKTKLRLPNVIYFDSMSQRNKFTMFRRNVRRTRLGTDYVSAVQCAPRDQSHLSISNSRSSKVMHKFNTSKGSKSKGKNRQYGSAKKGTDTESSTESDNDSYTCDNDEKLIARYSTDKIRVKNGYLEEYYYMSNLSSNEEEEDKEGVDYEEEVEGKEDKEKVEDTVSHQHTAVMQLQRRPITHLVLQVFCKPCDSIEKTSECSICLEKLTEHSSSFGKNSDNSVIELNKCKHKFHECCLEALYENGNKDSSLQCPICKTIHGTKHGDQPPGHMTVTRMSRSVPGYERHGSIQITYDIRSGTRGPTDPNPGSPYTAMGFPRIAYLPDNHKGNTVLKLLQTAWNRKLIFTIATSVTTGSPNCVVWNEIHHKTEGFSNSSGHGYPDPNYLDNVLQELKSQGVE